MAKKVTYNGCIACGLLYAIPMISNVLRHIFLFAKCMFVSSVPTFPKVLIHSYCWLWLRFPMDILFNWYFLMHFGRSQIWHLFTLNNRRLFSIITLRMFYILRVPTGQLCFVYIKLLLFHYDFSTYFMIQHLSVIYSSISIVLENKFWKPGASI